MSDTVPNTSPGDDPLGDIFGAIQTFRVNLAIADQQYSDVKGNRWTLGNFAAHWNLLSPDARMAAIALVAVVGYLVVKGIR